MPTEPANQTDSKKIWTEKAGNIAGWTSAITGALAGLFQGGGAAPAQPETEEKPKPKAALILLGIAAVLGVVYFLIKRKGGK